MFNADFFPTPAEVAADMLDCLDLRGKIVLEPSAGSGNLIQACLERGAQEILWCEQEPKLQNILKPMGTKLKDDFLQVEAADISHIDLIVMNPPFSADEKHILHAFSIAPPGCQIVSLCNWHTIDGRHWGRQLELAKVIEAYGSSENLGECFTDAERSTRIEIGLVRLTKLNTNKEEQWEGFFMGNDDIEAQGQGIIPYRRSRDIVNRYVEACKLFDKQLLVGQQMHNVLDGFFGKDLGLQVTVEGAPVSRNRFRKDLQKAAWKHVFDEFLPAQMATSQLRSDINVFVEKQSCIPFTERNLFRMLQIVAGTQEQRIDKAIEQAVDALTKHTKENRFGLEGWVTNNGYMLSQKFIKPYMAELSWSGNGIRLHNYGSAFDEIQDLIKALCYITGKNYVFMGQPSRTADGTFWPGEWYDWGFFTFKVFKKGTVHFKFKNKDDWAMLNQRYAKIKGQTLPEVL